MDEQSKTKVAGEIIIGFVIGAVLMGVWAIYYYVPKAITAEVEKIREGIITEQLANSSTVNGTVLSVSTSALTIRPDGTLYAQDSITVTTNTATRLYTMRNDDLNTKVAIRLTDLKVGDTITVKSNAAIGAKATIYAKDIIKL